MSSSEEPEADAGSLSPPKKRVKVGRAGSPVPSCSSVQSDRSMEQTPSFRGEFTGEQRVQEKRAGSPVPSCVSVKSDRSMEQPHNLRGGLTCDKRVQVERAGSPVPSCVSVKSDRSMEQPHNLRGEFTDDQGNHCSLESRPVEKNSSGKPTSSKQQIRGLAKEMYLAEPLERDEYIKAAQQALKIHVTKKFESIIESLAKQGHPTLLNDIYTEIYITEGVSGEVNNEHEIRQIETMAKRRITQETAIPCNDIFKAVPGQERPRTVLTKGIAGIGKTVSVQKFILDWAEGKANQDIDFIFTLPFRDLNLKKKREFSLMQLLQHYFPQLREIRSIEGDEKVVLIFDGLDECRLPLDFQNKICHDITESSSVDVLLTNLIQGNLLPSAFLWITSRPAAANQIPPECVDRVTEIRGFNDPQKEEYFRKRIRDQTQASRIISHIKSSRSLHIMCHMPIFCRISAVVLETIFDKVKSGDLPKTLTEMYTHLLLIQTNVKNQKYHGTDETNPESDTEIILKLGQLAFQQLEKGNLIFYEEDLRERGIDVTEASVYSGVCTEIFKEECGLGQEKVYCFVHLSIQEYLAALFVFHSYVNEKRNALRAGRRESQGEKREEYDNDDDFDYDHDGNRVQLSELHKTAVDQAMKSKNGHLDLFLRFLLGLSLDSNQVLLERLLTQPGSRSSVPDPQSETGSSSQNIKKTVQYIKSKIRWESSAEKTINLFHCLNELNDSSQVEEIQNSLRSGTLSDKKLEPDQCSALAFVLLMSKENLDEFDLKTYNTRAAGYQRLVPVVRHCRKARLKACDLTEKSCDVVASALQSSNSPLRDLDLSYNNLRDSGVKLLCAGLMSPNCKLQRLGVNCCDLTEKSCNIVALALQSSHSPLRDLDLSNNTLQDSGVKLLCAGLMSPNGKLQRLGLHNCDLTEKSCDIVASALQSSNSPLRDLDLSYNNLGDSGVKLLHAGLMSPNCKLHRLDLSNNDIGDSGVKLLCAGLSPNCKLQRLGLGWCNLTESCCDVLASVLRYPRSELRDLELRDNELQDSGVRALSAGLEDPRCKLQRLGLSGCRVTQTGCDSLASALCSNPSHLRELDLRYNHPGDSGMRVLSAAKLDTLTLLVDHGGESRTKPGPRKYVCQLTLDPNTAHRELSLSEGNRRVTHTWWREEPYPDHPERFEYELQVACGESVCERCYWEAEWNRSEEKGAVCIAVTYKGLGRKRESYDCVFGSRNNSWSLECRQHGYSVCHNENRTAIPVLPSPYRRAGWGDGDDDDDDDAGRGVCVYRVGVFVDRLAGTLSFYSISDSDTLTLLHTFHTHFTEDAPLCAGFRVENSSVSLCHLE